MTGRILRKVEKEEIIADACFFLVSLIIALLCLYVFDIHWNFYPGGSLFPPERYIFVDKTIYLWGGLAGGIIGLFLIKLFLFGLKEEEALWKAEKKERRSSAFSG
jgi:hypothetical protein